MFYKAFAAAGAFPKHQTLTAKMAMPLPWQRHAIHQPTTTKKRDLRHTGLAIGVAVILSRYDEGN